VVLAIIYVRLLEAQRRATQARQESRGDRDDGDDRI
jgi:hypothetical protein